MRNLTKNLIATTAPGPREIVLRDPTLPGFHVRISPGGAKTYALYYRTGAGQERRLKLGRFEDFKTVDQARNAARDNLEIVRRGGDPAADRRRARQEHTTTPAYAGAVEDFIEKWSKGRRGNVTWKDTRRLLLKHGAMWHREPVDTIVKSEVLDVLDGIMAEGKGYTANRLYAAWRTFFDWCEKRDKVPASPMRGIERPFDGETERRRVFTDKEIKRLWQAADRLGQSRGAYLKVMLLTGKRRSALAAMRWDEINDDGVWSPPQDQRRRSGNKRTHVTPLPRLAHRIVHILPRIKGNPFVFAGRYGTTHIYAAAAPLRVRIRELSGVSDFYWHACRHTVETRLAELGVPPHIRDLVLDHAPRRGAGKGYDHYSYEAEMRAALEQWAGAVERLVAGRNVALWG